MKKLLHLPIVMLYALIITTVLTGCQAKMHESGVIINPNATEKIHIGVTTRAEVMELLGPPTFVNAFRNNRWLYIQDRKFQNMQRTFARVANRVEITFDQFGVVTDLQKNFDDQLLDPNTLPEATNNSWTNWLLSDTYQPPVTNPSTGTDSPEIPMTTSKPTESEPPKKTWWRFWSKEKSSTPQPETQPDTTNPTNHQEPIL